MSKAFVKNEDAAAAEPEINPDPLADIPAGAKNYMTPNGARQLRSELEDLVASWRPRLLETVNRIGPQAAGEGAEDFRSAKKELSRVDRRIDFLVKRLELAEVVDHLQVRSDRVRFGATVAVGHEDGTERTYHIVGIDEAEAACGKISWTSPLAKALLDARVHDVVTVVTPVRREEVEILEIQYPQID